MYALFIVAIMTNKLYSMYFKMGQSMLRSSLWSMPNRAMLPTIELLYYYAEHLLLTLITLSFELLNLPKKSENLICSLKLPQWSR